VAADSARLFVALELPADIRTVLSDWSRAQLTGLPSLRGVRPEALHITLCFLGQRPVTEVGEIATACRAVASLPAPALSLGDALWLPPRRPRVLAIDLADASGEAAAIQSTLAHSLASEGLYKPEHRRFLAHVTIARVRSGQRLRPTELQALQPLPFTAGTVTLYQSLLGRGPAQYEALESITLTG
jgi:2'-5' RNA ligase